MERIFRRSRSLCSQDLHRRELSPCPLPFRQRCAVAKNGTFPRRCIPRLNRQQSEKRMEALWLSMKLAGSVAAILLVIGMPVAYWLAFSSWRGKFLLESVVALPLVLPPTVLGFYALVAMGPRSPLGRLWITLFGHGLAFTFGGLILASVLYSFPFAVQPLIAPFEGVDRKLLDASAVLGAGRAR